MCCENPNLFLQWNSLCILGCHVYCICVSCGIVPVYPTVPQAEFVLAPHIDTVCLPEPGEEFHFQRCTATGWGKDHFGAQGQYQVTYQACLAPVPAGGDEGGGAAGGGAGGLPGRPQEDAPRQEVPPPPVLPVRRGRGLG